MKVYGIKNCNTVKSALNWLTSHHIEFEFHDFKVKGIDEAILKNWCAQVGWETLVNKRGTTWRQLDAHEQNSVVNESSAIALMLSKHSVIKRPVVESQGKVMTVGFSEEVFSTLLK